MPGDDQNTTVRVGTGGRGDAAGAPTERETGRAIPDDSMSQNVAKSRDLSQTHEKRETNPIAAEPRGSVSQNVAKCRGMSQAREKRKTNPNELTPRQRAALAWLIEGATVSAVADRLGVERRTVGRWKKHPRFVAEVDRRCAAPVAGAGAVAERVRVKRVTPLSKIRRAKDELMAEMEATRPKKYIWMGVEYPTFEAYMEAMGMGDCVRGMSRR
jgi:hypothetical protein